MFGCSYGKGIERKRGREEKEKGNRKKEKEKKRISFDVFGYGKERKEENV